MPVELHHLPTVLGPLNVSGNKTFTLTIRPAMAMELGCMGNGNDQVQVQSPIHDAGVQCGSLGNEVA